MKGTLVSHYRVLDQIGAGGMGVVYLAEDERLNRKVALKFITPANAGDTLAQRRLLREAQAASALDHPNIATVYEVGDFKDQLFIAMAYYPGDTLARRIARGPLGFDETASIVEQIAMGLATAHASGVVHRDLKPSNVIVTPTGQVKILDFGLAKVVSASADTASGVTQAGTTLGTLSYMAPEQAQGEPVDQRADVWALGVLLFEMLTGRQPFRGTSATAVLLALATESAPAVRSLRPTAPAAFDRVIERTLIKDPAARTITAGDVAAALAEYRGRHVSPPTPSRVGARLRRPMVAVPVVAAILVASWLSVVWGTRWANRRWAVSTALPEISRLADRQEYIAAVDLARQVEPFVPGNPELAALWRRIARTATIESEPPGAEISYTAYGTDGPWRSIGFTPLENVRLPIGLLRTRAIKAGFDTAEDAGFGIPSFTLAATGTAPPGMVRAAPVRGPFSIYIFGLETPRVRFDGFWIDRHEVTNRQFKAFVDAGGYRRPEFWQQPFIKDGKAIAWEQAVSSFRDATGRPGPALWSLGSYPSGEEELPVTGVSWYEAAAYAAYAGNALPTVFHWNWVASQFLTGFVIPLGNFNSSGPVRAADTGALHRFGGYGFAGNVKEWCFNEAPDGRRYILGGGWDEPAYMFRDADARSPFDRARNFGFRTVRYDAGDKSVAAVSNLVMPPSRNYDNEKPVTDEVFEAYRRLYSYDATDLAAKIESRDEAYPDWRVEKVTLGAVYGQERVVSYLLLPKQGQPPYQTVVFMPGAGAWDQRAAPNLANPPFAFIVKSGRAVAFPVYKGSFERGTPEYDANTQKNTNLWRDYVIAFSKDLRRTLDYLATRSDFDHDRIAYFGQSRGASLSPMMIAADRRIKTAVLWIPGFYRETQPPEVDAINFAPRVKIPVLQLSGRYDYNFPEESSSQPFFKLLGTPPDQKRRVVFDTGHNLPPNEAMRETLDWLDRYLGPVR